MEKMGHYRGSHDNSLAEKCARIAVEEAEAAAARGTFGVGGLLIENSTGRVLKKAANRVVAARAGRSMAAVDPTAHVEKQLVDWYYRHSHHHHHLSKKAAMAPPSLLPPAADLTIVCSLDPCMMCTGAILGAGLNVIRISDDPECGVSCRGQDGLSTLPAEMRQEKAARFSEFGLRGKRNFSGSPCSIFSGSEIDPFFEKRSTRAFMSGLGSIRERLNKDWISPGRLENPMLLVKGKRPSSFASHMLKTVRRYNPRAFSKGRTLGQVLIGKARESYAKSGLFNSACLIDPFGNILLAEGADPTEQTPLLCIMRRYYSLVDAVGDKGRRYLAHPKHCKMAILFGPARGPTGLMEAGSLGSFFEGKLPKKSEGHLEYVIPRQESSELEGMLRSLPPFYSKTLSLQGAVRQTQDGALVEFCKARIPRGAASFNA